MRLDNGVWAWANIQERYDKEYVTNNEKYLAELANTCWQFPKKKVENPFVGDYVPETYEIPALEKDIACWYQYLIGMLRMMVK